VKNATNELWDFVQEPECLDRVILPKSFIIGLRKMLESGMSCEQVIACFHLMAGLFEISDQMDHKELLGRVQEITRVIAGDIEIESEKIKMSC